MTPDLKDESTYILKKRKADYELYIERIEGEPGTERSKEEMCPDLAHRKAELEKINYELKMRNKL